MSISMENISFDDKGLIPAIVQDEQTGEVLMLAYMNEQALKKTIETKETWFYSRSRQELWNKGATSGNRQIVKQVDLDCDSDSILVQVSPKGPACHTGENSCFYQKIWQESEPSRQIIHELIDQIKHRRSKPVEGSYTSYLFREGLDKVLKKVGEESSEVIIGAKNENQLEITSEMADLIYHSLVLMEIADVDLADIKNELLKRRTKGEVTQDE